MKHRKLTITLTTALVSPALLPTTASNSSSYYQRKLDTTIQDNELQAHAQRNQQKPKVVKATTTISDHCSAAKTGNSTTLLTKPASTMVKAASSSRINPSWVIVADVTRYQVCQATAIHRYPTYLATAAFIEEQNGRCQAVFKDQTDGVGGVYSAQSIFTLSTIYSTSAQAFIARRDNDNAINVFLIICMISRLRDVFVCFLCCCLINLGAENTTDIFIYIDLLVYGVQFEY